MIAAITGVLTVMGGWAIAAQDKYTVKVPNRLSFADFRGYEDWQAVGPSHTDATNVMRLIVANPVMISAYKNGIPGNGKPFPRAPKLRKLSGGRKRSPMPRFLRARQTRCLVILLRSRSSRRTASDFRTRTAGGMPHSSMTPEPIHSRLPPRPASRRRGTTRSAALRATISRRQRINFSRHTPEDELQLGSLHVWLEEVKRAESQMRLLVTAFERKKIFGEKVPPERKSR
jgi:hypothetical protein